MIRHRQRRGFTLVEMLVVMAIIVLITAGAMLVVPGALNRDRSTDAVTSLRGWLEIAQARAARDGAPRGLRLIVDPTKPTATEQLWVTEAQYIESPPVLLFNPNPPYPNGITSTFQPHPWTPRVEFLYTLAPVGSTTPPAGTVTGRQCAIRGLTQEQASVLINSTSSGSQPILWMPVLGTWQRIIATNPAYPNPPVPVSPATNPASYDVGITLDHYPDTQLGASTSYVTHHFGIYAPPRPLLGEPTMQLPTNTCVDLNAFVSRPDGTADLAASRDFDLLFAPNGPLAFSATISGDGHVFLCVRDPRKGSPMDFRSLPQIQAGGEMMILGIKARSGAISVQPVDHNPITMTNPNGPYTFVLQSVSGQ
jgi:prepilin-type N-terminal cleavage/methylation domain-containing protein